MAIENYINDYTLAVSGGINGSSTSLTVNSAASIDGGFRILCQSELMYVSSGGTGTSWTVIRGIEGTAAVGHTGGTGIHVVLTSTALDNIRKQISAVGTLANLPTSGMKSGDQYQTTDSPYRFIYDGSVWQAFVGSVYIPTIMGSSFDTADTITLTGNISNSQVSIGVSAGTSRAMPFEATIDSEVVKVTAGGSTTTWTVTRAYDGTSGVGHNSGASVTVSNWRWMNQTSSGQTAAVDLTHGGMYLSTPPVSGDAIRMIKRPIPTSGAWTRTLWFLPFQFNANSTNMGLLIRESSTGKLNCAIFWGITTASGVATITANRGSVGWPCITFTEFVGGIWTGVDAYNTGTTSGGITSSSLTLSYTGELIYVGTAGYSNGTTWVPSFPLIALDNTQGSDTVGSLFNVVGPARAYNLGVWNSDSSVVMCAASFHM